MLILTEVGKVAHVAQAVNDLDGGGVGRGPRRPLRRHRQDPCARSGSAGPLVASRIQAVDGVTRTTRT